LQSHIGSLEPRQVHDQTLEPFVTARLAAGASATTINRSLEVVRTILNRADQKVNERIAKSPDDLSPNGDRRHCSELVWTMRGETPHCLCRRQATLDMRRSASAIFATSTIDGSPSKVRSICGSYEAWTSLRSRSCEGGAGMNDAHEHTHRHKRHHECEHDVHAPARTPAPQDTPGKPLYTCPMHPEIVRDAPGSRAICGRRSCRSAAHKVTTPTARRHTTLGCDSRVDPDEFESPADCSRSNCKQLLYAPQPYRYRVPQKSRT
jgi:hypothetical protein